jgi:hypothetical protein
MAKAAPKRSRRSTKAAAVRQRGSKRTRKTARARKTADARATRNLATWPKPPALARERRTLTEEPAAPTAVAPEMETSSSEPQAAGEAGASAAGATNSVEEDEFE